MFMYVMLAIVGKTCTQYGPGPVLMWPGTQQRPQQPHLLMKHMSQHSTGHAQGAVPHSEFQVQAEVRSPPCLPSALLTRWCVCPCGHSVSLVVQWVDVTRLEKNATLLFPESIRVDTRDQELFFSMFLNIGETFKLMEQLANLAMRQLLDNEGFLEDRALPRPTRPHRNVSALKRCVAPGWRACRKGAI